MEDLITHLLSLPESERSDFSKLLSHSEQAYKCYELQRHDSRDLPQYSFKAFVEMLFRHSPSLAQASSGADLDLLIERWRSERRLLQSLIGAIIINPVLTKCLLVQNISGDWELPMTNLEVGREEIGTAVEHVCEKMGLDISGFIRDGQVLEGTTTGSRVKLFIAVLDSEMVQPQKPVRWFTIKHLPCHYGDVSPQRVTGVDPKNLFGVMPFVKSLWEWIAHQSQGVFKDTPDPRPKGPKPVSTQPPPVTPLRSMSHSKTKASSSKLQPRPEAPIIAHPVASAQESLQDAPHAFASSPCPPALPLSPPQHTPTHMPALHPSPPQHTPIPYCPPGAMYLGGPQPGLQGFTRAPPMIHYGTPLPAYRGPVHGYGPAYSHTPFGSRPLPAMLPYSGKVGVWTVQDSAHMHQSPLHLECAEAFVNFRFKGSLC
eukprot:Em0009g1153a